MLNQINSRSQNKIHFALYPLAVVASFVFGMSAVNLGIIGNPPGDNVVVISDRDSAFADDRNIDLDLFWLVWNELETSYVEQDLLDYDQMVYGAIKGMVNAVGDPYTVFMDPDETEDFNVSLQGKLEGIGAELTIEENVLVIVTPLRDSPAEKAGLLPGDIIYKVEDEFTGEMTLHDAITKIRGEKGTTVNLTILREDLDEPFEVSIVRDSIEIESVTFEVLEDDIGYLAVNQFSDTTMSEFNKAISEMLLDEPKGLILDLRFNGGGYLDVAVSMLSYLLPSDLTAVQIVEIDSQDKLQTSSNPKLLDVPMVVLINEGSASASEIVAGAIQDHKRGIVMGTKSFGKGTVQEVKSFEDGSSIRITIAKWLTPLERDIDHLGIEPDIVKEISDEDIENEVDSQKEAAIEYLKNL